MQFCLLVDFGDAVLAGREHPDGSGYQFVTWIWNHDRIGVGHGHYYEGNFQNAKADFAVRSGLISRAQLFTQEELMELYRATDLFSGGGPGAGQRPAERGDMICVKYHKNGWSF